MSILCGGNAQLLLNIIAYGGIPLSFSLFLSPGEIGNTSETHRLESAFAVVPIVNCGSIYMLASDHPRTERLYLGFWFFFHFHIFSTRIDDIPLPNGNYIEEN